MALQDMSEWELLGKAAAALKRVEALPIGSALRSIQWAVYESYKAELDERAAAELQRLGLFGRPGGVTLFADRRGELKTAEVRCRLRGMPPRDTRTALYRLYDAHDVLLYVGITARGNERFIEHFRTKPWGRKVRRQTAEWYDRREAAEEAEQKAIETEQPLYNVAHSARAIEPLSATEARLLLHDLRAVVTGAERVRVAELPSRLRYLAPDVPMYQKMNGVRLAAALTAAGVRTINTGNVLRLDPADLAVVSASGARQG